MLVVLTCSLSSEVEYLRRLAVTEEVPGQHLGLVLSGGGEMREQSRALPPPSSLLVNAGLPGHHLHLGPSLAPGLPVENPEAVDLRLAVTGPGQGVGVAVQTDGRTGEDWRRGQPCHQHRGVGRAQLVAGLALVRPEHLLGLHVEGEQVSVGLLADADVVHVVVEDDAVPGPDDHGPGGGVDHALQLLLQLEAAVDLRDGLRIHGGSVCKEKVL